MGASGRQSGVEETVAHLRIAMSSPWMASTLPAGTSCGQAGRGVAPSRSLGTGGTAPGWGLVAGPAVGLGALVG
jgi:hypothetical protein